MLRKTVMTAIAAAVVATASFAAATSSAQAGGFGITISYNGGKGWNSHNKAHVKKGYKKGWTKTSYRTCQKLPVYGWKYGKQVIVGYKQVCR